MAISPTQHRLLAIITDAAERGDVCPTNTALCEALGVSSVGQMSGFVKRLELYGYIQVDRASNTRVVTVQTTGKRTAGPKVCQHWTKREPDVFASFAASETVQKEAARAGRRTTLSEAIMARADADQARLTAERTKWLQIHADKYGRPTPDIYDMPA